jgi:hypothetical protein
MQSGNYRGIDDVRGPDASRESGGRECEARRKCFVLLKLGDIRTAVYIHCNNLRRAPAVKLGAGTPLASAPRMLFARPEMALASTIKPRTKGEVFQVKTARPGASQSGPMIFQLLTRRLNDLRKNAPVREASPSARLLLNRARFPRHHYKSMSANGTTLWYRRVLLDRPELPID